MVFRVFGFRVSEFRIQSWGGPVSPVFQLRVLGMLACFWCTDLSFTGCEAESAEGLSFSTVSNFDFDHSEMPS